MAIKKSTKTRQSKASREGANFRKYVKACLNSNPVLIRNKIKVVDNKDFIDDEKFRKKLSIKFNNYKPRWNKLFLVAKNLETNKPIALISSTLSIHGRIPGFLFYSIIYQELIGLKTVLVTPDRGLQNSNRWHSEWGSPKTPTKNRALAQKFLAAVYVDNDYLKEKLKVEGKTNLGGNIYNFSELSNDLVQWNK